MRVVAVSATLPNIVEVAEFIGASEACAFDESFRPVPLARHVVGLGYIGKNEYRFWSTLDKHVPELINKFSNGKQTLVFCNTKKETESLVGVLIQARIGANPTNNGGSGSAPGTVQYCLENGVAYHHAGMELTDRKRIEQAFLNRQLKCLCATSTLAVGVNLPAHLVIVKGTRTWRGGGNGYQEIDRSSLLQMIGRAGRPGLDTSGTAVIMTDNKSKNSIEQSMQGLGPAESYLLPKLLDVMNIEISQRVIADVESAINWLKTTFLYCRLKEDPEKYGCQPSASLDSHLHSLCQNTLSQLRDTGLVLWRDDGVVAPLQPCHIMSQNMISFDAMKRITELPSDTTQAQLLTALSEMDELHFPVRRLEKKILNECHKTEIIRFKLGPLSKVRIQRPSEKAFVLLQAYIGQHHFPNFTLGQEMTIVADTAQRLLSAAQEYSIRGSQDGRVALLCLKLRRSLHFCLWGESSGVLNQIPTVGQEPTRKLMFNGIRSFERVMSSSEDAIENAAGSSKPFGSRLKSAVAAVLNEKLKICAEIEYTRSNIAAGVTCNLEPAGPSVAALTGAEKATITFSLVSTS
jgi:ATP-dependent DNA helicase HFM1/MER3